MAGRSIRSIRPLAHSSVENLGLIGFALGMGLIGLARSDEVLAALGLGAGLFHVWNHAVMKGLMFFTAGAVQHSSGTRDLERLGGLIRPMPRVALLCALGALGLAALPPLSGFASEWLLYLAPKLLGRGAKPLADLPPLTKLSAARQFDILESQAVGPDLRLRLRPRVKRGK